jgi:penicillin-binding protein 1A
MPSNKRSNKALNVYANLNNRRRSNKDYRARRKAEYLATLPKHPVKRFAYRLHPKRFFSYWFSREGGIMALKIAGVGILLMVLMGGALFAYYRRELDAIRPSEINKRVQTTVSRYYDRNGKLLWEDKGDGDYKLVIKSEDIANHMKQATIAIEDKDFYKHAGFSFSGILRAALSNVKGDGATQGGSTLTQQLVKQVFFADEANNRGLGGIPRKIKEVILSVEVERMYNKDQILRRAP